MMSKTTFRAFLAMGALAAAASFWGCVADRPSRNGVFNENQYLRKDFLIEPGDGSVPDRGWFLKSTVTQVSTPNPLGGLGIVPGTDTGFGTGLALVRFRVTQDKLQMLNVREISDQPSDTRTEEVLNAWPAISVDLKYRINLDGEKTNYYEENQELDWQVRQWVKLSFDKNDMSDTAPLGNFASSVLARCTDLTNSSATLMPGSFSYEDDPGVENDYVTWTVNVTVPVKYDDAACVASYSQGPDGQATQNFGRQNVSFNLKYSMVRAKLVDPTGMDPTAYHPLVVDEKDPIRHKYGVFNIIPISRDDNTHLLAARQLAIRWDPAKPITYYFTHSVPDFIKHSFIKPGGIQDQTNQVFSNAGAAARVTFLNWNDDKVLGDAAGPTREYGDVRYSFVNWVTDLDANTGWLGYGPSAADPRTGEIIDATVNISDSETQAMAYQIDFFLSQLGASPGSALDPTTGDWPAGKKCKLGDTMPLVPSVVEAEHNAKSSLFTKMQQYLQKPVAQYGNLGPQDFVAQQDADFAHAYYAIIPYQMYSDPDANSFVIREGGKGIFGPVNFWDMEAQEAEFHKIAASIDRGETPFIGVTGPDGLRNATDFANHFKALTVNHAQLEYAKQYIMRQQVYDPPSAFTMEQIAGHAARHCIAGSAPDSLDDGGTHWETKTEWVQNLTSTFYGQIAIHEFGHTLGLQHNFMGSVDRNNFTIKLGPDGKPLKDVNGNPRYALYTSSVMEYSSRMADIFDETIWGPYDVGAISWIYSNTTRTDPGTAQAQGISGQISKTVPWNDPAGFDPSGNEIQFLYCHHEHLPYTPLCRQFDSGSTPSEIIANSVDSYDWGFNFTNYRVWRKYWDNSKYANAPASFVNDLRRFLSQWLFDWSSAGELTDTFRRIGIKNPDPNGSDLQYFTALTNKFNAELSAANQVVAAFHKAVIQQSAGERPIRTIYDQYYGDVSQQGIILDKYFAMQGWVGLWPSNNFDPNQAGAYIASYSDCPDSSYQYTAEDAVDSMIGGQYDAFPYFAPLAVAIFAQDTHSPSFGGRIEVRDWIGGHVFYRLQDFLDYFRDLDVQNNAGCTDIKTCDYDPRNLSDTHNEFFGPDKRLWIWAYIPDRNQWVAVDKERNTASYVIVRKYTDDVVFQLDDGAFPGGAYNYELPMKYFLDSFGQYN